MPYRSKTTISPINVNTMFLSKVVKQAFRLPFHHSVFSFSNKSKKEWLMGHNLDPFVKKVKQYLMKSRNDGYRSRAAYKLIEMDQKYGLINDGSKVFDLGSAPGSWSQAVLEKHPKCTVVAIDLLEMKPIKGVQFHKGDATDENLMAKILGKHGKFDTIISDMAPNFSGTAFDTHSQIIDLNLMCLSLSAKCMAEGGNIVMKTLQGQLEKVLHQAMHILFKKVDRFKPKSSKSTSSQLYIVGVNLNQENRSLMSKICQLELDRQDNQKSLIEKLKIIGKSQKTK